MTDLEMSVNGEQRSMPYVSLTSSEVPEEDIRHLIKLIKALKQLSENDDNVPAKETYQTIRKNSKLYRELYLYFYISYPKCHPVR